MKIKEGQEHTKKLPFEVLLHSIVVADEYVAPDRLIPRQRLRRRQRLESLVHRPIIVVVIIVVVVVSILLLPVTVIIVVVLPIIDMPRVHQGLGHRLVEVILHHLSITIEIVVVAAAVAVEAIKVIPKITTAFATVVSIDIVVVVVEIVVEAKGHHFLGSGAEPKSPHLPPTVVRRGGRGGRRRGVDVHVGVGVAPDTVANGEVGEVGGVEAELVAELPELSVAVVLHSLNFS